MDRFTPWQTILNAIERFKPGFSTEIKGASEEEIAILEQTIGRPLPSEYREFLSLMGHGLSDLNIATCDFDINTALSMYKCPYPPPPDVLFIGEQQDDEKPFDICISLTQDFEGRVINARPGLLQNEETKEFTPIEPVIEDEALSLQSLVFCYAYEQYKLKASGKELMFIGDEYEGFDSTPEKIQDTITNLGYTLLPLYDAWNHYYENENAVIAYIRPYGKGDQLYFSSNNKFNEKQFIHTATHKLKTRRI